MADPASAFMIGSTIVSAGAAIWQGAKGAQAAEKDAAFKKEQAVQVEASGFRDDLLMQRQRDKALGQGRAAAAESGVDASSGSTLLEMEDLAYQYEEQRASYAKSIAFRADQLRKGADISYDVASDRQTAGWLNAGGTVLTGAGQYYKNKDPNLGNRVTLGSDYRGVVDPNAPSISSSGRGK